jgi:hydroxypyruvate isomerase
MLRFAANLSFLFGDVPFLDRFERAAAAGFKGVEYLFPYDYRADEISARLSDNGLSQILFNAPPGDWAAGDRGLAALAGREAEFRKSIDEARHYADRTGVRQIHVMAGIAPHDDASAKKTYLTNLEYAANLLSEQGLTVLIEPLNRRDMPGYYLASFEDALQILRTVNADNIRLQFDLYHRQILCGDVTVGLRDCFDRIGHIQIAGVPARNEPDTGELSLPYILRLLEDLGYDGWIGCEYRPLTRTHEGLAWFRRLNSADPLLQIVHDVQSTTRDCKP